MDLQHTRREILRGGLAAAGLGMMGVPEWVLPALAQGAAVVPFLDFPETFNANPAPDRRLFDSRTLTSFTTPKDQFFTTQHYGHPVLDEATFKLKVTGLVNAPKAFSIAELKAMPKADVMFGFECSGNRAPVQGLCSNGKWTGVPLATVLKNAGLKADAREIRLPRRRPRRGRSRVAHAEVQPRPAVRPQHAARQGAVGGAAGGLRLQRRAAHPPPGLPAAPDRARLVRRRQRQVAVRHRRAAGSVSGQVPGALVPHRARRDDQRRDEVDGERRHPSAAEVVRRPHHQGRRHPQGGRRRAERRHADEGRSR